MEVLTFVFLALGLCFFGAYQVRAMWTKSKEAIFVGLIGLFVFVGIATCYENVHRGMVAKDQATARAG